MPRTCCIVNRKYGTLYCNLQSEVQKIETDFRAYQKFREVWILAMYMQFDFCCDTAIITYLPRLLTTVCCVLIHTVAR